MSDGEKLLIVNADDFGFTRDVNDGIVEAHTKGILTATTLMANGSAFKDAVALAKKHPTLDVGCHLVLVGGASLLPPHRPYPETAAALLGVLARGGMDIDIELDAQVRRIIDAGITPTHLDTHKHTHLLPFVLRAVCRLANRYQIPFVRRPFDLPMHGGAVPWKRRALGASFGFLRPLFHRVISRHMVRTTDHFAGFSVTGHFETRELVELLEQLPHGSTEFMTHPGFCTAELQNAPTRLKESRRKELDALCSPEARDALRRLGIRLATYREI